MPEPLLDAAVAALEALPRGGGVIRHEQRAGTHEVILDHPARAGAISPGMMLDLHHAVDRITRERAPVVVLHSTAPRAFCAGGDLRSVRTHLMDRASAAAMVDVMTHALDALAGQCAFVVAAVEGPALGGGAELLTACDHVVLGERALVGFVHAGLGVSPGWGGGARLVRRVGRRTTLAWLMRPAPRRAPDALREGMADEVVAAGTALERGRAVAAEAAGVPAEARRVAAALAKDPATVERAAFLELWGGPDHRAALARVGAGR